MKTIIAGSRTINDLRLLERIIEDSGLPISEVVCGGARGVDDLGRKWAGNGNRIPIKFFIPNWEFYGKSAGLMRNIKMAEYADALIALWDGESKGTKHMIDTAKKYALIFYAYNLKDNTVKKSNNILWNWNENNNCWK